jgi:hypothetical protein
VEAKLMVTKPRSFGTQFKFKVAPEAVSDVNPSTKTISIVWDGLYLDNIPVIIQELDVRLRRLKAVDPDLPVVIKGGKTSTTKTFSMSWTCFRNWKSPGSGT